MDAIIAFLESLAALLPDIPEIKTALSTAIEVLTSGSAMTPEQQMAVNAGLIAANQKLQSAP